MTYETVAQIAALALIILLLFVSAYSEAKQFGKLPISTIVTLAVIASSWIFCFFATRWAERRNELRRTNLQLLNSSHDGLSIGIGPNIDLRSISFFLVLTILVLNISNYFRVKKVVVSTFPIIVIAFVSLFVAELCYYDL